MPIHLLHGFQGNVSQAHSLTASEVDDAEIDFASLEMGTRIGMGVFGEVFKAHWRQTTVAVKKFLDQRLSDRTLQVGTVAFL